MATPPKKQSVEERTIDLKNPSRLDEQAILEEQNQKWLKQEGISGFEDRRNSGKPKRSNDNDDELSGVTPSKRPKELLGHNNFDTSTFWTMPTHKRQTKKPTDMYVSKLTNIGPPMFIVYFPLAVTRTQTNTSNINSNSDTSNDVCE